MDSEEKLENEKLSPAVMQRRAAILASVRQSGFVTVEALVRQLDVTPQTLRKDIAALDRQGSLRRFHGGAGLPSSAENVGYPDRKSLNQASKRDIAAAVAEIIPDGASLLINIGTTTEEVARALLARRNLRVITNNINVANVLVNAEGAEVIIAGGTVRRADGGIVGPATADFVNQFRVDFGIIGISGIDLDGTLLDFDHREVEVAHAIIRNSRYVIMASDSSKFGRPAMVRLGHMSDISCFVTDVTPPAPLLDIVKSAGVELIIATSKQCEKD